MVTGMELQSTIIPIIDSAVLRLGLAETTVSRYATGDHTVIGRLRTGGVTVRIANSLLSWIAQRDPIARAEMEAAGLLADPDTTESKGAGRGGEGAADCAEGAADSADAPQPPAVAPAGGNHAGEG